MISQTTDYALRAIVLLAMDPLHSFTTQQIAKHTKVPGPYMSKVMQNLVKAKLVLSQRGLGGGFMLARDPDNISILEVVIAIEPLPITKGCSLEKIAHNHNICAAHKKVDEAMILMQSTFASTSIRQILNTPGSSIPLFEVFPAHEFE